MMAVPELAHAQQLPTNLLNLPVDGSVAAWIIRTFGLLTVLSVAPGILIMVTSFPRFVIAFSILRSGMGLAVHAVQHDPAVAVAVHDLLRHGADLRSGLEERRSAAAGQPDQRDGRPSSASPSPFRTFMTSEHAREGPRRFSSISPASAARRSRPARRSTTASSFPPS